MKFVKWFSVILTLLVLVTGGYAMYVQWDHLNTIRVSISIFLEVILLMVLIHSIQE